jgi:hypothetical protein
MSKIARGPLRCTRAAANAVGAGRHLSGTPQITRCKNAVAVAGNTPLTATDYEKNTS